MNPTIFMAWLSSTSPRDGGYWTPQAREAQEFRDWSENAPRHLSFHTSREAADAELLRAARAEWDRAELSYAHGPWGSEGDSDSWMLTYMGRHCGYELHVTEQPVQLGGDE